MIKKDESVRIALTKKEKENLYRYAECRGITASQAIRNWISDIDVSPASQYFDETSTKDDYEADNYYFKPYVEVVTFGEVGIRCVHPTIQSSLQKRYKNELLENHSTQLVNVYGEKKND